MTFESGDLEKAPKGIYSGNESIETRSGGKDKNVFANTSKENKFEFLLK
jgi:hypothetical protein